MSSRHMFGCRANVPAAIAARAGVRLVAHACLALSLAALGCGGRSATTRPSPGLSPDATLSEPVFYEDLQALCRPPAGWQAKPVERLPPRTIQRVWVSPTGLTAYGVMHVDLPLPVGPDLALWGFMTEMRRTEGRGQLLSREDLPGERGLRFSAEGTRYRMRGILRTRGMTAWVAYAGTLCNEAESPEELAVALRAREETRCGTEPP